MARLLALLLLLAAGAVQAEGQPARIAIILDDMGYNAAQGESALALPDGVTYAFLPHAPHTRRLAALARERRQEIMLHLPMQAIGDSRMDTGALHMDMDEAEFRHTLAHDLAALPGAVGVNNHMGSLLTRHPGAMAWLMRGLAEHGDLYYVDSRTHVQTVAEQQARELGLPAARRDVFLDNEADPDYIQRQLELLVAKAKREGSAIAIGHPYPETLAVLARELPRLAARGVKLVPVSSVIALQGRQKTWQVSSFPSQTVAKNSKQSP